MGDRDDDEDYLPPGSRGGDVSDDMMDVQQGALIVHPSTGMHADALSLPRGHHSEGAGPGAMMVHPRARGGAGSMQLIEQRRRIRRPFTVGEVAALVEAVETLGTGRWVGGCDTHLTGVTLRMPVLAPTGFEAPHNSGCLCMHPLQHWSILCRSFISPFAGFNLLEVRRAATSNCALLLFASSV